MKLEYDDPLSTFAFNFNVRHYIVVKENINCENDVEPQYFTKKLGVPVCGNCGDPGGDSEDDLAEDHLVPPTAENLALFSMVAPQCRDCKQKGMKVVCGSRQQMGEEKQAKTAKKAKRSAKQQERATRDAEQRANHMA